MPVKIIESDEQIRARLLFVLREKASKAFKKAAPIIEAQAKIIMAKNISESPTISSLLNGKLKGDFGLTDEVARRATSQIISYVSNNVNVSLNIGKDKQSVASISLFIPPLNTSAFLTAISGSYQSVGVYGGGEVNWLDWLLTKGVTVVIDGFSVFTNPVGESRSGFAVMVQGGEFRVDPEFAGVEGDNFITKAVAISINEINTVIKKELTKALK